MFFRGVETINQIMYLYYMMLNLIEQSRFFTEISPEKNDNYYI